MLAASLLRATAHLSKILFCYSDYHHPGTGAIAMTDFRRARLPGAPRCTVTLGISGSSM